MLKPIRGNIWQSHVNSFIGLLFVGSCALWATILIVQASWGVNPVTNALAATLTQDIPAVGYQP